LPATYKNSQEINKNDFLVVNSLNSHFTEMFIKKKKICHKKSLENDIKRLEDLEIRRLQEIEMKKEEKKRRREEFIRIKKENELIALKNYIQSEIINNMELNDDPSDIGDAVNFHIRGKKAGNKFI
jgi:hypothetical protein